MKDKINNIKSDETINRSKEIKIMARTTTLTTAQWWKQYRTQGPKTKMEYNPITRGMLDLNGIEIDNVDGNWFITKDGKPMNLCIRKGKPGPKYPKGKETLWLNVWGYRTEDSTEKTEFQLSFQAVLYAYFIGTVPSKYVVHHIDDNPLNNKLDNLQLVTRAEHSALHRDDRKKYALYSEECKTFKQNIV